MLTLQIKELSQLRGIKHPYKALRKAKINHTSTSAYLTGNKKNIMVSHIEALCILFKCTPNDLFSWTPDTTPDDTQTHPLYALKKQPLPNLQKIIGNLSLEEVKKRLQSE